MNVKLLLLLLSGVLSFNTAASVVADINVGRVLISDQSMATQSSAGRDALKQVFIKITGSDAVLSEPTIEKAIVNFEQFLIASSFVQRQNELVFEARFNQEKLMALLKASKLPIWTNLRPNASLWLGQDDPSSNVTWLNQNTAMAFNQKLQQLAFERGVSIILPLGDLNDAMQVSDFDVWTQNTAKLVAQSRRYDTAFVISATIKPLNDEMRQQYQQSAELLEQQLALERMFNVKSSASNITTGERKNLEAENAMFRLNWIFKSAQQLHIGESLLRTPADAAAVLVDEYANMLASQYTLSPNQNGASSSTVYMNIKNIASLADFNQALALIESMPQVNDVQLLEVSPEYARFKLALNGRSADLANLLALDTRLSISRASMPQEQNIQLIWQP